MTRQATDTTTARLRRTSGRRIDWWRLSLVLPALVLYVVLFVIPVGATLLTSVVDKGSPSARWYTDLLTQGYYWQILGRTLWLSMLSTVLSIVIGYVLAYLVQRVLPSPAMRKLVLFGVLAPLFTSAVVRAFGWLVLLGQSGPVNTTLQALHLTNQPLTMTFNDFAVVVGLTHVLVPFAYMTLSAEISSMDRSLELASQDLGASIWSTLWYVTLPLSRPALVASASINFTLAVSSYVVPAVLGGGKVKVLAALIYETFSLQFNWPLGSAIAVFLFVPVMLVLLVMGRLGQGARQLARGDV